MTKGENIEGREGKGKEIKEIFPFFSLDVSSIRITLAIGSSHLPIINNFQLQLKPIKLYHFICNTD